MTHVAVILSGCGYLDGAEIRESVLSLLYLDQQQAKVTMFAPDQPQMHVVNHKAGAQAASESRNVLTESARIARGEVEPLSALKADDFDALVIPGGFGVAKNLSDFALKGADCTVNADFKTAVTAFYEQEKPIGAICIAPAVVAAALKGTAAPKLTIGEDAGTASAIEACGATHQNCATDGFVYDEATRIASCSAYMREDNIAAVAKGIEQVVTKVLQVAKTQKQKNAA